MKKAITLLLSGALLSTFALSAAGCGEKADYEATAFANPDVLLTGIATGETNEISDTLFGVFLEDINYASYVLDDNMVVNGSFESTHNAEKRYGWDWANADVTIENGDGALASLNETYRTANTNPNYAKVVVKEAGGLIRNTGYKAVPMAIEKDTEYVFSAFIKATENVKLTVSVEGANSKVLEKEINLIGDSTWKKYTERIKATDTADSGLSLVLRFGAATTVYVDAVQLETTHSTIGFKQYAYDAIKDLAPKFVRFPGGCVIEGNGAINSNGTNGLEDSAYDWKNSIGAAVTGKNIGNDEVPALSYTEVSGGKSSTVTTYGEQITRTPNQDLWAGTGNNYYDMEYGIGFYEYFLLCDALNASAVPVLNCGLSCQGGAASNARTLLGRHGKEVEDYIQDALDLVAFAKGDPASSDANEKKWAQVRVNLGHEKPFNMTYLGIGNEQWGKYFTDYYNYFVRAFQNAKKNNPALYGDIKLIVGNGPSISDCEGYRGSRSGTALSAAKDLKTQGGISKISEYGVHDHHYYRNYTEFYELSTLYDNYSREEDTRYEVFVGEYSANESRRFDNTVFEQTNNSWVTALSEAAYMTGLERNADVVKLAAYAPMFASNSGGNQWGADMMFYTNTAINFTPNYYVQQLFMHNQGNYTFEYSMVPSDGFTETFDIQAAKTVTVNKLYVSFSAETETGDIIIKLVNACEDDINVNLRLRLKDKKQQNVAQATVLRNTDLSKVSLLNHPAVTPVVTRIGIQETFGYKVEGYSVNVIRVHTK